MSNYKSIAKRPSGIKFEDVDMLDDHFSKHEYGVRFSDSKIYKEEDCEFLNIHPLDK